VDALSTDSTLSIVKRYRVKLFSDSTASLAHQRLVGVEAAKGTYVMFVDSDVELGPGCITELLHDLEVNSWAGVHAKILSAENLSYWQRAVDEEFSAFQNAYGPKQQIGTAAAMFRMEILITYPFDPSLKESYEDIDLSRRLIRDGHVIGGSNALAYHYWRRDFIAFVKQRFRGGIGRARFGVKYRERMIVVLTYPLMSAFSRMMRSKGTRRIRLIPYWAVTSSVGFIGVLAGYSKVRHSSQTKQR
jgi:glycosyltransferase involved in cell wall biosynthesis